jgi:hypothetical protein
LYRAQLILALVREAAVDFWVAFFIAHFVNISFRKLTMASARKQLVKIIILGDAGFVLVEVSGTTWLY